MSGFFGTSEPNRWGGLLKQAISNVENTFDNLLIDQPNDSTPSSSPKPDKQHTTEHDSETETETYMDPISGMVTTMQRPKSSSKPAGTVSRNIEKESQDPQRSLADTSTSQRSSSDLSARLAAIMAEKSRQGKTSRPSSIRSTDTNKQADTIDGNDTEVVEMNTSPNQAADKHPDAMVVNEDESSRIAAEPKGEEKENNDPVASVETSENEDLCGTSSVETQTPNADDSSLNKATTTESNDNAALGNECTMPAISNDSSDSILKQREMQLLQAMQTIAKLHDQIHSLQEEAEKQQKENQTVLAELEAMKANNNKANGSAADQRQTRKLEAQVEDLKQQLASKSEQIRGLMEEGEKLSKTELKHGNVIKRLRSEKQDMEKTIADLQKKVEKSSSDLVEANAKIMRISESERRLQESFKAVSDLTERQTKHMHKLETDLREWKERYNNKETALKDAIANLERERQKARLESKQEQGVLLEKEQKRNAELKLQLEKSREESNILEARLRNEIKDLQSALHSLQSDAGKREDQLLDEVKDLQARLQTLDMSSAELDTKVEEATAPLLQQIDMLQMQHTAALKQRDYAEQEIALRLQSIEKERDECKALLQDVTDKYTNATDQLEHLKLLLSQERREASDQSSKAKQSAALIEDQKEQIESLQSELHSYKEKEKHLEEEIKKRYQRIMKERLQEERRQWELKTGTGAGVKKSVKQSPEPNGEGSHSTQSELPAQLSLAHTPTSTPRSSTDVATTETAVPAASERFQGNMRFLENQLSFYQTQLQSAVQSRDELSEEILNMNIEMENLRKENRKVHDLERQMQELEQRYHASLELLGERTEQVEELKADIADVKEMYRSQIVELVQKIDRLEKACT